MQAKIKEVADLIRQAKHLVVLTGAGISAESGVPTFRDAQTGLWAKFRPEDLATPEAFWKNPTFVWEWYQWRRQLIEKVKPNAGHLALAALENQVPKMTLITQNVDNLHQKAGSHRVIELHGNIMRSKCSVEMILVEPPKDHDEAIPRCPHCGSYLRPDVVWFGETLPKEAWMEAEEAARTADVFLSVGTSSVVYPAASLPWTALSQGASVIEINPEETPLSDHVTFALAGKAGEVLPAMLDLLNMV